MSHVSDIDGGYTEWSKWSECDVSCGGGVQRRERSCTNPSPSGEGKDCKTQELGPESETQECNTEECPIGQYTGLKITCMLIPMLICYMYVCMYVCIYECMYVCMHACM